MRTPRRGWYPDPEGAPRERFWDGRRWQDVTREPRAQRPPLWLSQKVLAVVLGVAAVAAVAALVLALRPMVGAFTEPSVRTPTVIVRQLDPGRYTVFEAVGSNSRVGPVTLRQWDAPSLGPGDIDVLDPAGRSVDVTVPSAGESIDRNGDTYTGVAGFIADTAGTYRMEVRGEPTDVIVTRGLFDLSPVLLVAFGVAAGVGCVAAVASVVLVLVRASRRRASSASGASIGADTA